MGRQIAAPLQELFGYHPVYSRPFRTAPDLRNIDVETSPGAMEFSSFQLHLEHRQAEKEVLLDEGNEGEVLLRRAATSRAYK